MDDTPTQWGVLLGRGLARPCGWLSFSGTRTAAAVHGRIVSWGGVDGEKTWTVPNRAGNGPRDRRQAGIGGALPDIALGRDHDGVTAALIVAHEHGSDLEVAFALVGAINPAPGNDPRVHGRRRARLSAETQPSARASKASPQ